MTPPAYPVVDCTKLPCTNLPEDKPFFTSDSGIVILALIPICAVILGYFIRRWLKTFNDVAATVPVIAQLQVDRDAHKLMLEKLTTIVNNTNTTLTQHLQWSQHEDTLLRQEITSMRKDDHG